MKQAELFSVRQVGNLTMFEPDTRLASGTKNIPAITSPGIPPSPYAQESVGDTPAPATISDEQKQVLTNFAHQCIRNSGGAPLPPFARNSETSRQAAIEKYDAHNSGSQREMILRWISFCGDKGATREEIQEKLNLSGDTVRPRIKELLGEAKGWTVAKIKRNGQTRKTKSGLNAEALVAI